MYQTRDDIAVTRFGTGITPSLTLAATPVVTNQNAVQSRRNSIFARVSATGVVGNFGGWSCAIVDGLNLKSSAILSYSFAFEYAQSASATASLVTPILYDKQQAAVTAAAGQVAIVNATDLALLVPPGYYSTGGGAVQGGINGRGAVLVNPYLESGTGGITVREFGLGIMCKFAGTGTVDGFLSLELKLYDQELPFFQPSK